MRTYFVKTPISIAAREAGPEIEVNAIVGFNIVPVRKQALNEPAEPASVEIIKFRLFRDISGIELACPDWLAVQFTENEAFHDFLMSEARDQDEAAACDRADAIRDERRPGI